MIAVAQPVSSVLQIRIMTDVIQWLRRNLFILQELPVQSHQEKSELQSMEKINGVCYNGSGKIIPGAITRGMDVSEWQGNIDWNR